MNNFGGLTCGKAWHFKLLHLSYFGSDLFGLFVARHAFGRTQCARFWQSKQGAPLISTKLFIIHANPGLDFAGEQNQF